jgi:hypothetical protein
MNLSSTTPASLFNIRIPIYNGRKIGLATYKVGTHNEIRIEKKDKDGNLLYPLPLYISGVKAREYPIEPVKSNPSIKLYIIPISDLEVLERR